jgi:hypothetical protein
MIKLYIDKYKVVNITTSDGMKSIFLFQWVCLMGLVTICRRSPLKEVFLVGHNSKGNSKIDTNINDKC